MKFLTQQSIIQHWPAYMVGGYIFSLLAFNPLLELMGIDQLEIHYRLCVIFLLTFITTGGILWTALPLGQALLGLTFIVLGFYLNRKKWGHHRATGFVVLTLILFLISIGKLKL